MIKQTFWNPAILDFVSSIIYLILVRSVESRFTFASWECNFVLLYPWSDLLFIEYKWSAWFQFPKQQNLHIGSCAIPNWFHMRMEAFAPGGGTSTLFTCNIQKFTCKYNEKNNRSLQVSLMTFLVYDNFEFSLALNY